MYKFKIAGREKEKDFNIFCFQHSGVRMGVDLLQGNVYLPS